MTYWANAELERMAAADEMQISTPRHDGTVRPPLPIWVVRHGDALYVRSYRGEDALWYRSATTHNQGRISAGGIDADVSFAHVADEDLNREIDAAYRSKYARYGARFLDPMTAPAARATTLKLIPS
jgi:hypothetical protein